MFIFLLFLFLLIFRVLIYSTCASYANYNNKDLLSCLKLRKKKQFKTRHDFLTFYAMTSEDVI